MYCSRRISLKRARLIRFAAGRDVRTSRSTAKPRSSMLPSARRMYTSARSAASSSPPASKRCSSSRAQLRLARLPDQIPLDVTRCRLLNAQTNHRLQQR